MLRAGQFRAPLNIVILTCRPPKNDFRYHLAVELAALGHQVTYVFLKRRPDVTDMATKTASTLSLPALFTYLRRLTREKPDAVVLNSTNLAFPLVTPLLRLFGGGTWCFDMHDDLLYASGGWRRTVMKFNQGFLLSQSDMIVHSAPTLQRLFPTSVHLGNGSSLTPLAKTRRDASEVLVLASLDHRFDFTFLRDVAGVCGDRRFHIHGWVSQGDAETQAALDALRGAAPNVLYHGPYSDEVLPELLAAYIVALAPYRVGSRTTEFIDPLRFYHCLASDVALVSTAIPQAVAMRDQIHLIEAPEDAPALLDKAVSSPIQRARTWGDVARRFEEILTGSAPGT